ncbi:MAG: HEPN domain-containing protein [Planctomycetota bacterium]
MKPTTSEWVEKAEGDFRSAAREMRARKAPNYDLACFCAEQCAEKYLKALLHERGRRAPRTHDLTRLLEFLVADISELELIRPMLEALTAFAVEFRYPGASATKPLAGQAYRDCTVVREAVRWFLRLPAQAKLARSRRNPSRRR